MSSRTSLQEFLKLVIFGYLLVLHVVLFVLLDVVDLKYVYTILSLFLRTRMSAIFTQLLHHPTNSLI